MKKNYKELLNHIKTFVFDVDGVLTDGTVQMIPGQQPVRTFHSKDGYILQLAIRKGYKIAIITGGKSLAVKERLEGLGISDIYLGAYDKIEVYKEYEAIYNTPREEVLYMGDDMPDYEVLEYVGVATCPSDAAAEIKNICDYVSPKKGGQGCVRDVIEQTLKVQGNWMQPGDHTW